MHFFFTWPHSEKPWESIDNFPGWSITLYIIYFLLAFTLFSSAILFSFLAITTRLCKKQCMFFRLSLKAAIIECLELESLGLNAKSSWRSISFLSKRRDVFIWVERIGRKYSVNITVVLVAAKGLYSKHFCPNSFVNSTRTVCLLIFTAF